MGWKPVDWSDGHRCVKCRADAWYDISTCAKSVWVCMVCGTLREPKEKEMSNAGKKKQEKKLTAAEAKQMSFDLWSWLALTGKRKDDWERFEEIEDLDSQCVLCTWTNQKGNSCGGCPLADGTCEDDDGLYEKWLYAISPEERRLYASQIAAKIAAWEPPEEKKETYLDRFRKDNICNSDVGSIACNQPRCRMLALVDAAVTYHEAFHNSSESDAREKLLDAVHAILEPVEK